MSRTATLASLRPCGAMLLAVVAFGWYVDQCRVGTPSAVEWTEANAVIGCPRRPGDWPLQRCDDVAVGAAERCICEPTGLLAVTVRTAATDRRGALVILPRHFTHLPEASVMSVRESNGGNPQPAESHAAVQHSSGMRTVTRLPPVSRAPAAESAVIGGMTPLTFALRVPLADLALNAPVTPAEIATGGPVEPPAKPARPRSLPRVVPLQVDWEPVLAAPSLDPLENLSAAPQDHDSPARRDFSLPGGGLDIRQLAPTRFVAPLPTALQRQ